MAKTGWDLQYSVERLQGELDHGDLHPMIALASSLIDQERLRSHPELRAHLESRSDPVDETPAALFVARDNMNMRPADDGTQRAHIIGFAGVYVEDGAAHVGELIVDGRQRHKGIGKMLLSKTTEWAAEQGAEDVQFDLPPHNDDAATMLEHQGFETVEGLPQLKIPHQREATE